MSTQQTLPTSRQIKLALQRLEMLIEPDSNEVLSLLLPQHPNTLQEIGQQSHLHTDIIHARLDELRTIGLVFHPKHFPHCFGLNKIKCVRLQIQASAVAKDV